MSRVVKRPRRKVLINSFSTKPLRMPCIAQELPAELIQQIFASFSTTLRTDDTAAFPWFLGHVCSRWRSIFLNTTQLWHTISISLGLRAKNITQFFLERNPAAPFSFTFSPGPHGKKDNMRQILKMLTNESTRWKDVSLWVDSSTLLPLTRVKDRLPLLRTLHIHPIHPADVKDLGQLNAVLQPAPSLRVVSMPKLVTWELGWPNLKDLTLTYDSPEFYTALPLLTNLERLCARFQVRQHNHSNDIAYLTRLITLRCDPALLQKLKAPALDNLAIDCMYAHQTPILPFLQKSCCSILRLQISECDASTALETLSHTPQIVQLKLKNIYDLNRVIRMLIISTTMEHEPLVPQLLSLHIRGHPYMYMSGEFIQSPWPRLIISRRSLADDFGCKKLLKLGTSGVPDSSIYGLISLCNERGVEYVREEKWD